MSRKDWMSAALVCAGVFAFSVTAPAQQKEPAKPAQQKPAAAAAKHVVAMPDSLTWGPAPPALPPGAQVAVVDGDPMKAGSFSIRLKFPAGYSVPAHWHPTDENIVVISGAFMIGMGNKLDEGAMQTLPPGGYAKMPRTMRHFAMVKEETIIHLYGTGPFVLNYVNPADDPRKKTTAAK